MKVTFERYRNLITGLSIGPPKKEQKLCCQVLVVSVSQIVIFQCRIGVIRDE
jgi:hypothetical protein